MKQITLLLLLFSLFSCKNERKEIDVLRDSFGYNGFPYEYGDLVPVHVKCKELKDSVLIVTYNSSLYLDLKMNMKIMDYVTFAELVTNRIHKYGYIEVDSTLFKEYKKYPLKRDAEVDSIYQSSDIKGLLKQYVNNRQYYHREIPYEKLEYIAYLLFQHRIPSFDVDDSIDTPIMVSFYARDDEEELKKLIGATDDE